MEKQKEIALIDATLKLLRRGKFELQGEEALVFYGCFEYLVKRMEDLKKPDIQVANVEPIKEKRD